MSLIQICFLLLKKNSIRCRIYFHICSEYKVTPENRRIVLHTLVINYTTSWSRSLPLKLIVAQLLKDFFAFFGTGRYTTMVTRALHWTAGDCL